jgi:hypothetical protein
MLSVWHVVSRNVYLKFIDKVLATAAMLFICVAVLSSMQVEYLVTILDVLNLSELKLSS